MRRQTQTRTLVHGAELVDRHVVQFWLILNTRHLPQQALTGVVILRQIVPLPDASSFLEISRGDLVVAVRLGL